MTVNVSLMNLPREFIEQIVSHCDRSTLGSLSLTCRLMNVIVHHFANRDVILEAVKRPGTYRSIPFHVLAKRDIRVLHDLLLAYPEEIAHVPEPERSRPDIVKIAFIGAKALRKHELCARLLVSEGRNGPLHTLDVLENGFFQGMEKPPSDFCSVPLHKSLCDDGLVMEAAVAQNGAAFLWASPRLQKDRTLLLSAMKTFPSVFEDVSDFVLRDDIEIRTVYYASLFPNCPTQWVVWMKKDLEEIKKRQGK